MTLRLAPRCNGLKRMRVPGEVGRFWQQHGLATTDGLTFAVTVHQHILELAPALHA